jgi:NADPH:quinone reductase-like Zn-dependent oxidoreductase
MAQPDLVRQVVDFARTAGVKAAYQKVQSRLDNLAPLGCSCAGIVIAAGPGVSEFQPRNRVWPAQVPDTPAIAKLISFPKTLRWRSRMQFHSKQLRSARSVLFALQGFRQSQAVLGEIVAVIGAGLVGVLTSPAR